MVKIYLIILITTLLPSLARADSINVQCTYEEYGLPDSVLKKIEQDPQNHISKDIQNAVTNKKWWQFWINGKQIILSINKDGSSVIPSLSDSIYTYKVDMYADTFTIHRYFLSSMNQKPELESEFTIIRTDGIFFGHRYAPDDSWQPFYNKGDIMWSYMGTCKPYKTLF